MRAGLYGVASGRSANGYAAASLSLNAELGSQTSLTATAAFTGTGGTAAMALGFSAYASLGVGSYPQGGTATQFANAGIAHNVGAQVSIGIGPFQVGYALEATGFNPFDAGAVNNQASSYQSVTATLGIFGVLF